MPAPPDDLLDRFEIDTVAPGPPAAGPAEPRAAVTAGPVHVERVGALDSARALTDPERPPTPVRHRRVPVGPLISLAVHLSPLLLLLSWSTAPAEIPAPIPVQLVLEEPPPPPPPPPPKPQPAEKVPETKPTPMLASRDMGGAITASKPQPQPQAKNTPAEAPSTPEPPTEVRTASLTPPRPAPPQPATPDLVSGLPAPGPAPEPLPEPKELKFAAPVEPLQTQPEPKPAPPKRRSEPQHAGGWPLPLHPRNDRAPGPQADRDTYLAYCADLIRRNDHMLPASVLAGRSGVVQIFVFIMADGRIGQVGILESSGYREIDARALQMVAAVGRFPPLPQRFQGPNMAFRYILPFHDGTLAR